MFNGIIAFPSFMFPVAITVSPIVRVIGPSFTGLLLILSFTVTSSCTFPAVWFVDVPHPTAANLRDVTLATGL